MRSRQTSRLDFLIIVIWSDEVRFAHQIGTNNHHKHSDHRKNQQRFIIERGAKDCANNWCEVCGDHAAHSASAF